MNDITGKRAVCYECGEEFIIGKPRKGGRERKVRCEECGGSGIKSVVTVPPPARPKFSQFTEEIMDGMIPDLDEDA